MGAAFGPPLAEAFVKVPIDILISYIFGKIRSDKEVVSDAAKVADAVARAVGATAEISKAGFATTDKALDTINRLIDRSDADRAKIDELQTERLESAKQEIETLERRNEALEEYREALESIPKEKIENLLNIVAPLVPEMGKPVMRSAEVLRVSGENAGDNVIYLNRDIIEKIGGNEVDDLPTIMDGEIVRYDKQTGWGKFKNEEFNKPISFVVPSSKKNRVNLDVIDAMKSHLVEAVFYKVSDKRGIVRHLIFDSVEIVEDEN